MTGDRARRPFVDQPVTDLAAARRAAAAAAERWALDDPVLLRSGMNAMFTAGAAVLRVGTPTVPASASIELAAFLRSNGIDVPPPLHDGVVVHGSLSVTAWTRLEHTGAPIDWVRVGRMVNRVHALDPTDLPGRVPLPSAQDLPWWDFEAMIERARGGLDAEALTNIRAAVDRHRGWEDRDALVLCHGDVHPGNVIMTASGPVLLDWDLLCSAPAAWDHAPLMTWEDRWGGAPGEYEAFAAGYGRSFRGDPSAESIAELRLVAATLMRVIAGLSDPRALPEAHRRLRYWAGDPDAPMWSPQ